MRALGKQKLEQLKLFNTSITTLQFKTSSKWKGANEKLLAPIETNVDSLSTSTDVSHGDYIFGSLTRNKQHRWFLHTCKICKWVFYYNKNQNINNRRDQLRNMKDQNTQKERDYLLAYKFNTLRHFFQYSLFVQSIF